MTETKLGPLNVDERAQALARIAELEAENAALREQIPAMPGKPEHPDVGPPEQAGPKT